MKPLTHISPCSAWHLASVSTYQQTCWYTTRVAFSTSNLLISRSQFSPELPVRSETVGYVKSPSLKDKVHCVAFVVDASKMTTYPKSLSSTFKQLREHISDLGEQTYYTRSLSMPALLLDITDIYCLVCVCVLCFFLIFYFFSFFFHYK